ncbi:MAG: MoaD/ThiS family protein [Planctomycetota bacterium]
MPSSDDQQITVTVALRSILARYRPNPEDRAPFAVQLDQGATVGDLLDRLRIDPRLAHLVFVDHVRRDRDAPLENGASVDVFPPIAGG